MSKLNPGTILLVFLAILFGLIGTWAFREYSKPQATVAQSVQLAAPAKVIVPMASRTLEPGHEIKIDDIALVQMTRDEMKEHGYDKGFMSNASQIVGKVVKEGIRRGRTFDTKEFFPDGSRLGISERLEPGQRAITVSLTPTNALIGFAGAGQNVDVLFHYGEQRKVANLDNEASSDVAVGRYTFRKQFQSATVTLVQNATILALGNRAAPTADANGVLAGNRVLVTLAVAPRDAEAIRVADGNGELSLTLRGPDDDTAVELGQPKLLSEIIEIDSGVRQMEIYRGTQVTHHEFDSKGVIARTAVTRENIGQRFRDETLEDSLIGRSADRSSNLQSNPNESSQTGPTVVADSSFSLPSQPIQKESMLNARRRASDSTGSRIGSRR